MKFHTPFLLLFGILLFTHCTTNLSETEEEPPNILFIMSDDHTSQAWGVYGSILDSLIGTTNIRRLRDEGCLLQNAFSTNSICVPSRATIMTGQYSHQNGVYTLSDSLNAQQENLAKLLQQQGYHTAVIGKWHLKSKPTGFNYFNVLPGQGRYNNPVLRTAENWEQGQEYEGFSSDVITRLSLEWMEEQDTQQPFFLMCHFKATHEPFDYPERYDDLYEDVVFPEPAGLFDFRGILSGRTFSGQVLEILGNRYENDDQGRYPQVEDFSTEGLDSTAARRKIYQKFVRDFLRSGQAIDDNIGRLLDYLDIKGLAKNTIVVYTSDQGYFLGEHGFFDKRLMYEEAMRMPFVIRYPGKIPAASTLDDIVLNTDFAPTLLDYAGLSTPSFMQGRSFRQNLQGDTPADWRSDMYYRYWLHQEQRPAHFGIRTEQYKLIFFYGQPLDMTGADQQTTAPAWEFYDLQKDPKELINRYNDPAYAETIAELKDRLQQLRQETGDTDEQYPVMQEILSEHWTKAPSAN